MNFFSESERIGVETVQKYRTNFSWMFCISYSWSNCYV